MQKIENQTKGAKSGKIKLIGAANICRDDYYPGKIYTHVHTSQPRNLHQKEAEV